MFDIFCPREKTRVLLFASNIEAVRNTFQGIEVHYHCHCGHHGIWQTGLGKASIAEQNKELSA
jgi:hypothetical protein